MCRSQFLQFYLGFIIYSGWNHWRRPNPNNRGDPGTWILNQKCNNFTHWTGSLACLSFYLEAATSIVHRNLALSRSIMLDSPNFFLEIFPPLDLQLKFLFCAPKRLELLLVIDSFNPKCWLLWTVLFIMDCPPSLTSGFKIWVDLSQAWFQENARSFCLNRNLQSSSDVSMP